MNKKRVVIICILLLLPLVITALTVVICDPFFHYHKPIKGYPYALENERYQNDGIAKHFDYELMITGSSTTQVLLPSCASELWGCEAVRMSFAGGSLYETAGLVDTAVSSNKDLKVVIRGLDIGRLVQEKDTVDYEDIPEYLYDKNPFNDYRYLFNRDVMTSIGRSAAKLASGQKADSFDDYENWNDSKVFGKEAVLTTFERLPLTDEKQVFTEEDRRIEDENLYENIIKTAKNNPDIEFIVFIPPVNVCYWDASLRSGGFDYTLDALSEAFLKRSEADNIKVYAFDDCTEITCNFDNYIDGLHFGEETGKYILESIHSDNHRITMDNKDEYLDRIRNIYSAYDYESIFK